MRLSTPVRPAKRQYRELTEKSPIVRTDIGIVRFHTPSLPHAIPIQLQHAQVQVKDG